MSIVINDDFYDFDLVKLEEYRTSVLNEIEKNNNKAVELLDHIAEVNSYICELEEEIDERSIRGNDLKYIADGVEDLETLVAHLKASVAHYEQIIKAGGQLENPIDCGLVNIIFPNAEVRKEFYKWPTV